jgi:hypothetical protein
VEDLDSLSRSGLFSVRFVLFPFASRWGGPVQVVCTLIKMGMRRSLVIIGSGHVILLVSSEPLVDLLAIIRRL